MKMERPNAKPLSPEELKDLEKLQTILEQAIADGYVTADEMNTIKCRMNADGKVLFEELELCRKLIWDKIQKGELEYSW
jgi:uncharacterized membrane protein YebE (DUF533 family)